MPTAALLPLPLAPAATYVPAAAAVPAARTCTSAGHLHHHL
jgi:hypothetical protein